MPVLSAETANGFFRPLLERLEKDRQVGACAPDELRELLFACGTGVAVLERLSQELRDVLNRGIEGKKLGSLLRAFAEITERALSEIYPKLRQVATNATFSDQDRSSRFETLNAFRERAVTLQQELSSLQQWVADSPPVSDFAATSRSTYSVSQVFENTDEVMRRLASDGEF